MLKAIRRWRTKRQIRDMTAQQSALLLRCVIEFEIPTDPAVVGLIADKAAEAAEGPVRTILQKIAAAGHAGRTVKFGTFPATFSTVPVDPTLVAEIEEALRGKETN